MSYEEVLKRHEELEEVLKKHEELLVILENAILENNKYKKIIFGSKGKYTMPRIECAGQISFFEDIKNEKNEDFFDEIKKATESVVVYKK